PQCSTRDLGLFEDIRGIWVCRIPKHGHAREPGQSLFQQFEPLATQVWYHEAHARDVAAGSRQTGHEPAPQRIASGSHDNWDRRGSALARERRESPACRNDVYVESDQLRREFRQAFESILSGAILEGDIFSFDPSHLSQSILEYLNKRGHRCI